MTNVKFRAWDTQAKRYARLDSIQFDHLGNGEPVTIKSDGAEWSIKRFELEQWTGFKDKNGREIYEGDILKGENEPLKLEALYRVNDLRLPSLGNLLLACTKVEVIGNIHENGELLK